MGSFLIIWPSGSLRPSLASLGPFLSLVSIVYSLHTLALPHGFLTRVRGVSVTSRLWPRYFLVLSSTELSKQRQVITCTRELPGKSRSCSYQSWNLYEICFCLRFCCAQSGQQVLAKRWARFPVGLCKALQDNKRLGGTEWCGHFWLGSRENVRQLAAAGRRTAGAVFPQEQRNLTAVALGSRTSQNGACTRQVATK